MIEKVEAPLQTQRDNPIYCRDCFLTSSGNGVRLCYLHGSATHLLEACRQIGAEIRAGQNVPSLKAMQMVLDAIAKAEGRHNE
jgi:hypothetical protein